MDRLVNPVFIPKGGGNNLAYLWSGTFQTVDALDDQQAIEVDPQLLRPIITWHDANTQTAKCPAAKAKSFE